jgi:hypothetical protein
MSVEESNEMICFAEYISFTSYFVACLFIATFWSRVMVKALCYKLEGHGFNTR